MSSTKPQYEILEEQYPGTIVLQLRGNFYNAFSKSAIAVSDILHYKLRQTEKGTYKCGIPANVLSQRLEMIKAAGVGYVVYEKGTVADKYIVSDKTLFEHITTDFVYLPRNDTEKAAHNKCEYKKNLIEQEPERDYQKFVLHDNIYERFKKFCASKAEFDPEVCFNWIVDEGLQKWGF